MAITKFLIPALTIVSAVAAQCSVPAASTTTVTDSSDATALASKCSTFSGSIAVATEVAGDLSMNGIKDITGFLSISNTGLTSFTADQLTSVGNFSLDTNTKLTTVTCQALNQVGGLNFTNSAIGTLDFGTPGLREADSVIIANSALTSLSGIDGLKSVGAFQVVNNPYLATISLAVTNINETLEIGANDNTGSGLSVAFPNLQTGGMFTFRNVSSLTLQSLESVTGNLGFYGNFFQSVITPNLTSAGAIIFVNNAGLTNISMPALTVINGTDATCQIANNTDLKQIDGFTKLSNVQGDIDFSGTFTNVSLPSLKLVTGALNLQTSSQFDCGPFEALGTSHVVRGKDFCSSEDVNPGTAGNNPSSTASGGGSKPTGAAGHVKVDSSVMFGGLCLIAGLLHMLF